MLQLVVLFDVDDTLWWATPGIGSVAATSHTNPGARVLNLPLLEAFCNPSLRNIEIKFHMLTAYHAGSVRKILQMKQGRDGWTVLTRAEMKTKIAEFTQKRIEIDKVITSYDFIYNPDPQTTGSYYTDVLLPLEQERIPITDAHVNSELIYAKQLKEDLHKHNRTLKRLLFQKIHEMYVRQNINPIYIFIDDKREYLDDVTAAAAEVGAPLLAVNALKPHPTQPRLSVPKTRDEYLQEIQPFVQQYGSQLRPRIVPATPRGDCAIQ